MLSKGVSNADQRGIATQGKHAQHFVHFGLKNGIVLVSFFGTTNAPAWAHVVAATLLGEATTGPQHVLGFGVGKSICFWVRKADQG